MVEESEAVPLFDPAGCNTDPEACIPCCNSLRGCCGVCPEAAESIRGAWSMEYGAWMMEQWLVLEFGTEGVQICGGQTGPRLLKILSYLHGLRMMQKTCG